MEELKKNVEGIVKRNVTAKDYSKKSFLDDLSKNGCASGMVGGLIYYTETEAFTKRHRKAIMELLADDLDNGAIDGDIIADAIQSGTFDNWLCWYSFERIALDGFDNE